MSRHESEALNGLPTTGLNLTVGSLTEEEYREWIEQTFKPMFEPYEQMGGIPCRELLNQFQFNSFGLPQNRRKEIIIFLDGRREGRITFEEFRAALTHKRNVDLHRYQRLGLYALLAANPGLRLAAAQARAIRHLQLLDAAGRSDAAAGLTVSPGGKEKLPNAITGYIGGSGPFQLEPDGVWPTSRIRRKRRDPNDGGIPILLEEYVPEVYLEAVKCRPPPVFCPLIVVIQICVYIYYAVELNRRDEAEPKNALTFLYGFPYFSPLYFDPRKRREVWRFFTYFLVHQGVWPIIFNSLVTLLLGSLMEWAHGIWRILVIYLPAGVFAGSLAASMWDPTALAVGASGGTYALIGGHLSMLVAAWEEVKHDHTAVGRAKSTGDKIVAVAISRVMQICVLILLCGIDFALAIYTRYSPQNVPLRVSFSPIPAGFIAGILIGYPLLREFNTPPWQRVQFWICLGVALSLLVFAVSWNIFWGGYPAQLV